MKRTDLLIILWNLAASAYNFYVAFLPETSQLSRIIGVLVGLACVISVFYF